MPVFPKITIVTPNYNYGYFLEQTILSVINQGYPNLEYIIIDGGSTDNSVEIIKKYEQHLAYWVSEPDKGMYDAINKGFAKSSGDIMAWLNSDDMYFPWAFKVIAEVFSAFPEISWLSSLQPGAIDYNGYVLDFGHFNGFSKEAFIDGYYANNEYSYGFIQQESTFWTSALWKKSGSYVSTEVSMAGDFELWCRFFLHAQLFGIKSPLAMFRFQHAQQSSAPHLYGEQCQMVLASLYNQKSTAYKKRKMAKKARMDRVPGIMQLVQKQLGFSAPVIVRQDRALPTSSWQIQFSSFF